MRKRNYEMIPVQQQQRIKSKEKLCYQEEIDQQATDTSLIVRDDSPRKCEIINCQCRRYSAADIGAKNVPLNYKKHLPNLKVNILNLNDSLICIVILRIFLIFSQKRYQQM